MIKKTTTLLLILFFAFVPFKTFATVDTYTRTPSYPVYSTYLQPTVLDFTLSYSTGVECIALYIFNSVPTSILLDTFIVSPTSTSFSTTSSYTFSATSWDQIFVNYYSDNLCVNFVAQEALEGGPSFLTITNDWDCTQASDEFGTLCMMLSDYIPRYLIVLILFPLLLTGIVLRFMRNPTQM